MEEDNVYLIRLPNGYYPGEEVLCDISPPVTISSWEFNNLFAVAEENAGQGLQSTVYMKRLHSSSYMPDDT